MSSENITSIGADKGIQCLLMQYVSRILLITSKSPHELTVGTKETTATPKNPT